MCDRVFVEWANGSWVTSGRNSDFQSDLAELVAKFGPPSKVEFRAAGEGYAAPADDRLEKFASTPNDAGRYPSDEACAAFEAGLVDNSGG